ARLSRWPARHAQGQSALADARPTVAFGGRRRRRTVPGSLLGPRALAGPAHGPRLDPADSRHPGSPPERRQHLRPFFSRCETPTPTPSSAMNPPSILITEDEIMVARDLEQRLHKLGYQVADIVDTGEDAVQKTASLHPDLVLMDIRLSGEMDGIAAAVQIRSAHKTPVVFVTAHADLETLE